MNRPSATLAGGSYSGRRSSARFTSAFRSSVPCRLSRLLVGLPDWPSSLLSSLSAASGRCFCSKAQQQVGLLLLLNAARVVYCPSMCSQKPFTDQGTPMQVCGNFFASSPCLGSMSFQACRAVTICTPLGAILKVALLHGVQEAARQLRVADALHASVAAV